MTQRPENYALSERGGDLLRSLNVLCYFSDKKGIGVVPYDVINTLFNEMSMTTWAEYGVSGTLNLLINRGLITEEQKDAYLLNGEGLWKMM